MLASPLTRRVPTPLAELSADFLEQLGKPAGLWLPCDDPEGKARDFTGNSNTGTLNGGVTVVPEGFGVLGQAWLLNGSTGYNQIPHSTTFNLSKITVACLANVTNLSGATQQRLVAKWDGSSTWILEANNNAWTFWCNNGSSTLNAQSAASSGWHLIVGTYDGVNIKLYVDGSLTATTALAGALSTSTHAINIGTNETQSDHFMAGNIGLVDVQSNVLSADQVSSLYSALRTGEPYTLFEPTILDRWGGLSGAATVTYPASQPIIVPPEPFPFSAFNYL